MFGQREMASSRPAPLQGFWAEDRPDKQGPSGDPGDGILPFIYYKDAAEALWIFILKFPVICAKGGDFKNNAAKLQSHCSQTHTFFSHSAMNSTPRALVHST